MAAGQGERGVMAVVADLSAVIERASVDLALCEDPSGFLAVLENHGDPEVDLSSLEKARPRGSDGGGSGGSAAAPPTVG